MGIDCFSSTFLPDNGGSIGGRSSLAGSGDIEGTKFSFSGGSSSSSEKLVLAAIPGADSSRSAIIGSTLNAGFEAGFAVVGTAADAAGFGVGLAAGPGFAVALGCAVTLGCTGRPGFGASLAAIPAAAPAAWTLGITEAAGGVTLVALALHCSSSR